MIQIYDQIGLDLKRSIFPIKSKVHRQLLRNLCCCLLLLVPAIASAQKVVSGTVTDDKGAPVISATVTEKGVQNATLTDINGKFKIAIKGSSGKLVISFIGYKTQEVPISDNISVTLSEDLSKLNDVVVIGYGSVKKSDLTGSVSTIKGGDLNLGGVTANVGQALQGKAAGVQVQETSFAPGAGISITVRGGNSINFTNAPLFVVDGFTYLEDQTDMKESYRIVGTG